MKTRSLMRFICSVVLTMSAGLVGSLFTSSSLTPWYAGLAKPLLNPPAWIFGPVWTVLYILMGIAAYLIWEEGLKRKDVRTALYIYAAQLGLNVLWSIIFFGLREPGLALIEILALWLAILSTIFKFAKVNRAAAWLMIPYILWVTFAAYLNFLLWRLNWIN